MIYLQNPRNYYPIPIMWNNNNNYVSEDNEDDDSWEVRAFEEDTAGNLLGCTWPPRSYACTFCRREFRSAQALGGHMNVHRRDRARLHRGPVPLHQPQQIIASTPVDSPEPPSVGFPTGREFIEANALCVLYPIAPDHDAIFVPTHPIDYFPSAALLPIAPFSANNINPSHTPAGNSSSGTDPPAFNSSNVVGNAEDSSAMEELDLELRLGR